VLAEPAQVELYPVRGDHHRGGGEHRNMTKGPLAGGSLRDFCYLLIPTYPCRWA
jgi:hypothetical protein